VEGAEGLNLTLKSAARGILSGVVVAENASHRELELA
jgi:hypothetical protein